MTETYGELIQMKMKHSLLALAVGAASSAAVVTPAAAGDVTVYGRAQVEVAAVSWQEEASEVTPGACDGDNVSVADGCDGMWYGFRTWIK